MPKTLSNDSVSEQVTLLAQLSAVHAFIAECADVITAIENCPSDNIADYYRWQGHAEARRNLARMIDSVTAEDES